MLGYTATWAGMILSPGGLIIIMLIPLVGRLMTVIQTRYIIAIGFFLLGLAFIYSSRLVLDITYLRLVMIRSFADRRAGVSLRADQHHHLFDSAARIERRCDVAVLDVPQRRGIDRHRRLRRR